MPVIIGLIVIIFIGVIALTVIGLRGTAEADEEALLARLEEFTQAGEEVDLRELELSLPFTQRVIYPLARRMGEMALRFTPQNTLNRIARKLELAGSPANLDPSLLLAMQGFLALAFGGIAWLVITMFAEGWSGGRTVLVILLAIFIGFYFPQLYLSDLIKKRQKNIRKSLPDALDLLTICVEAGLGFDAAMVHVSEKWQSELSLAFMRVITEIRLGKVRREALRDMADRIDLPELTSFVAAVIQSEMLGVSLARVLRVQADQMRVRRRQRAEEEAHKAPVKMLIPMALLIFPALIILLMAPAGIKLLNSGVLGMF